MTNKVSLEREKRKVSPLGTKLDECLNSRGTSTAVSESGSLASAILEPELLADVKRFGIECLKPFGGIIEQGVIAFGPLFFGRKEVSNLLERLNELRQSPAADKPEK